MGVSVYTVVGIDPGWSGGVAVISSGRAEAEGFCRMTERDILDTLKEYLMFADVCFVERVHSMPRQGVASSFKFGHIYGFLRACVMSSDIPIYDVTPQKWQKTLGCLSGGDKNVTKSKAQQLYPNLKITHAIADAILIAEYGKGVMAGAEDIPFKLL
jgi:crossover junction endodeoxyribonuclease RuvC